MNTEKAKLSQVKTSKLNPRQITADKFNKLIDSILVLPKMLILRPIVVDNKMVALGGNMRNNALKEIAKMSPEQLGQRLGVLDDYRKKTEGERQLLIKWWGEWLEAPYAYIIKANELSQAEQEQFMIKDNVSSGSWDYDALGNNWDSSKLGDWGMDVWTMKPTTFAPIGGTTAMPSKQYQSAPDASEDDGVSAPFKDALPPELQGVDLAPSNLPKYQGDDDTARERVIISYDKKYLEALLNLLGIPSIDKVVYRLEEIIPDIVCVE